VGCSVWLGLLTVIANSSRVRMKVLFNDPMSLMLTEDKVVFQPAVDRLRRRYPDMIGTHDLNVDDLLVVAREACCHESVNLVTVARRKIVVLVEIGGCA